MMLVHYKNGFVILFALMIIYVNPFELENSFAEESSNLCDQNKTVNLLYTIDKGNVTSICQDRDTANLIISITTHDDGTLNVTVPREILNPVYSNCYDAQFFVLINGEETSYEVKRSTTYFRVLTIPFEFEASDIEIIGPMTSEGWQWQIDCNKKIPLNSPHQQIKMGISTSDIICKEGLELIFKSTDSSPACVKPETADILVERGWAKPL